MNIDTGEATGHRVLSLADPAGGTPGAARVTVPAA